MLLFLSNPFPATPLLANGVGLFSEVALREVRGSWPCLDQSTRVWRHSYLQTRLTLQTGGAILSTLWCKIGVGLEALFLCGVV